MDTVEDRYVAVPATALADLIQLAAMVADGAPEDQLTSALRAAMAQVRTAAVLEP